MEEKIPKAFISYSHDSSDHKRWVAVLATKLRENGVDVILDQWDLSLGDDLYATPGFTDHRSSLES